MTHYKQMELNLLSSQEDFHAKTSQTQTHTETKQEGSKAVEVDSGVSSQDSLKKSNQSGQSLKTWPPLEVKDLPWSYKISARSATMQNGILYQLVPLVPFTEGKEFLSLPTPTARDYKDTARKWEDLAKYAHKHRLAPCVAEREKRNGYLSLNLVEWMMGFPIGHTDCEE